MKRKVQVFMPDFDYDYFKIRDHMLSIPFLGVRKKYIATLLKTLSYYYTEYVIGPPRFPTMGEKLLKTIFHESNKFFPHKKGVDAYYIHFQLMQLDQSLDSWLEFQHENDLSDEEMYQSALVYEEDIPEALPSDITTSVLQLPCWNDFNRPVLIHALNSLFEHYADYQDRKIDVRIKAGILTDKTMNMQAFGYYLHRLGSNVEIKMNDFVKTYILINRSRPRDYNELTKALRVIGDETKTTIDSFFQIPEQQFDVNYRDRSYQLLKKKDQ